MGRKIVWHHWEDPFIPLIEEGERQRKKNEENHDKYSDSVEELMLMPKVSRTPLIVTNWGYFPVNDLNRPGNVIDFRVGHTNFNLTNREMNIIENVKGIEALEIQTRYRFRIGIGKLFNTQKTMKRVEYALCVLPKLIDLGLSENKISEINNIQKELKKSPYWTLMILPNGSIDSFSGVNENEVLEKYKLFRATANGTGGIVTRHKNRRC